MKNKKKEGTPPPQLFEMPSVVETERAVLGYLIASGYWDNEKWNLLKEDYFTDPVCVRLYKVIDRIVKEGKPVYVPTIRDYAQGEIDAIELADIMTAGAGCLWEVGLEQLRLAYVRRNAILKLMEAIKICSENHRPIEPLLNELEALIIDMFEEVNANHKPEIVRLGDNIEDIYTLLSTKKGITGLLTGFKKLDNMTGGLQKSDLIILAGRPSMGKTAFALNILRELALNQKKPVLMFSLEMSREQIGMRLLGGEGRVDLKDLRLGKLQKDEWVRLSMHLSRFKEAPIYIDDTPTLDVVELRARARRAQKKYGIELVILDYLQLMVGSGDDENRQQEVAGISRALKGLAKELNIPVIALSQLSRLVEYRKDTGYRPRLSDLRESGAIEQDADLVLFVYRPIRYGIKKQSFLIDGQEKELPTDNLAEIIIAKQRNGPTGSVWVSFIEKYASFEELNLYPEANEVESL